MDKRDSGDQWDSRDRWDLRDFQVSVVGVVACEPPWVGEGSEVEAGRSCALGRRQQLGTLAQFEIWQTPGLGVPRGGRIPAPQLAKHKLALQLASLACESHGKRMVPYIAHLMTIIAHLFSDLGDLVSLSRKSYKL